MAKIQIKTAKLYILNIYTDNKAYKMAFNKEFGWLQISVDFMEGTKWSIIWYFFFYCLAILKIKDYICKVKRGINYD